MTFRLIELRMDVQGLPEGQRRSGPLILAADGFVLDPLGLGEFRKRLRAQTTERRRRNGLAQESQPGTIAKLTVFTYASNFCQVDSAPFSVTFAERSGS